MTPPRELRRQSAPPYSPSDEERAALKLLDDRFRPDDPVRLRNEQQWELNRAFLAGFQYLDFDPLSRQLQFNQPPSLRWRSRMAHNLCRPYVRQQIATIGGFRPRFKSRPSSKDEEDLGAAATGEVVLSHYWDAQDMPTLKWELLHWLKTCGNAFLHVSWNPRGGDPIHDRKTVTTADGDEIEVVDLQYEGEMETELLSPYHVYGDDNAMTPRDWRWWIDARPRTVEWLEQNFPDKARLVPPGIQQTKDPSQSRWFFARSSLFGAGNEMTEAWKNWVFVRRMTEMPGMDYPNGRLVIEANGVVLFDGDNPHPTGKLSLVWFRDELVSGQLWAQCDLENMLPLQRTYNRANNKEIEHVVYTANSKILEHKQAQLTDSALNTEIGERVIWNGMHPPEWMPPPPMPSSISDLKASILGDFDRVTSSYGPARGQYQGKISGKAYISLIEQDLQNKTPVIDRVTAGLAEWGKLTLEWVQEYVVEERLIKIVGRGKQFDVMQFKGADLRGNTDITIDVDSMAPKSKAMGLELLGTLAPGQTWLNPGDQNDRQRVWRMLNMEDDNELVSDQMQDMREATIENGRMFLAEMVEPAQAYQDHEVHVFLHNQARKGDEYKKADPLIRAIFDAHVQSHYQIVMPKVGVTLPQGAMEETSMEGQEPGPRGGGGGQQQMQRGGGGGRGPQQMQPFS